MKLKSVLLLAVALGCGLVAMLGVQQVLSGDRGSNPNDNLVEVLVATAEIAPGTPLTDTNVAFKKWPKDAVPEGGVTQKEQYEERAVKTRTLPGEVIMMAKLGDKGVFGASNDIPEGMRVITVSVDLTMTSSGLILPGNRVDVIVTYSVQEPGRGRVTKIKTALEAVKVFATDSIRDTATADSTEIKAKNISLLVSPEEANVLKLAESSGKLHLSLRPDGDEHKSGNMIDPNELFAENIEKPDAPAADDSGGKGDSGETLGSFLDNQQAQTAGQTSDAGVQPPPEKPKWKIDIYSGGERRVEEVDLPDETELDTNLDPVKAAASDRSPLTYRSQKSGSNPSVPTT